MSTHTCPNCSNEFTGEFCNNCGQRKAHKITMAYIRHDLVHAFTHTDRGFFHMMGQLFVRPGRVAYEYIIEAKRKRYFPPFQYLIILSAIATIIVTNSHFIENTMKTMEGFTGATSTEYSAKQAAFMQKVTAIQTKYYNIMILLQIPFFALGALVVYKRKFKYNYAEFLTLQTFATAQYTIIAMLLMLTVFITKSWLSSINAVMLLSSLSFHIWVYTVFFRETSFKGCLKALISHLLGFVFFFLFAMVIGAIGGLIIIMTSS